MAGDRSLASEVPGRWDVPLQAGRRSPPRRTTPRCTAAARATAGRAADRASPPGESWGWCGLPQPRRGPDSWPSRGPSTSLPPQLVVEQREIGAAADALQVQDLGLAPAIVEGQLMHLTQQ